MSLDDAFSTPQSKRQYVRNLFATIADRYDLITRVLSYGQDARWKARLVAMANVTAGARALDLACGTGDIAFAMAQRGARTIGLDITHRMLQLASLRSRRVPLIAGDMTSLPFQSDAFDLVTTGYGLRNVPVLETAVAEALRVLKPGGVLLSLDFNNPSSRLVRTVYLTYLSIVGSALGAILHGDPDTYRYIPQSIRRYPGAAGVSAIARRAGFSRCEALPVLGGLMTIHRAVK